MKIFAIFLMVYLPGTFSAAEYTALNTIELIERDHEGTTYKSRSWSSSDSSPVKVAGSLARIKGQELKVNETWLIGDNYISFSTRNRLIVTSAIKSGKYSIYFSQEEMVGPDKGCIFILENKNLILALSENENGEFEPVSNDLYKDFIKKFNTAPQFWDNP